ncbi:MAG: UDP-glucose/GDP-mannose dehydrogenase family protein [Candidatus Omnitrophica bacterium]|nr:UDP-glucose/GDP-mannose dehydrogenase family protein [Candidatus Omnitrophota bacterium]MDD5352184.1 UDP-glucose/GDP-mannose dehydrogenase family protein [Candidatus Omnitrophota bacterium]MDD5549782.1 UDP-glucose/GDP-mannose dehydrogenase family protein [Candidatus Omnitrophota bacterium]
MYNIAVIGTGYVGLVTGACFAELGNRVICVDNDREKIKKLKSLIMPIYEPGLEEMIKRNVKEGRISFSCSIKKAVKESLVIFIAVGTPPKEDGDADLTAIENVSKSIALDMDSYKLIVGKSTVPVDTGKWIEHTIKINLSKGISFDVASNPEFLREGTAIDDFLNPDRIVIGAASKKAKDLLLDLYKPIKAPKIITDIKSAELIKHACNSFLATKVSYINAISKICELSGADVLKVAEGMGLDKRIGRAFLDAGLGFGGFCLPKDLDAFIKISEKLGYDFQLLKIVRSINEKQASDFIKKIKSSIWNIKSKRIAVLGLSFKPNTDDLRFAPSLKIIEKLKEEGAGLRVFDPQSMSKAKGILKDVYFAKDAYDAAKGCDCLLIVTEWNEFKELDFAKLKKNMRYPLIIDGRNLYDKDNLSRLGFTYIGTGR